MKKGKSILSLILVIAVTALFGMTCVLGLDLKGMGAAKNINLGLDLEGGVSITYQVKGDKPSQADMDDTVYKLQKRVEQYSTEAQAYQVGDNRISIEIPGVSDANKILEELGQPGSLYFIKHKDSEGNENYSLTASGYTLNKSIDELKDTDSIFLYQPVFKFSCKFSELFFDSRKDISTERNNNIRQKFFYLLRNHISSIHANIKI